MVEKLLKSLMYHSPFYWGFVASCILIAFFLQDFILFDNWNLMAESLDRGFVLSFAFINDWLNGGIQLWNRYNQLPYTFTHIQTGFYDLHKFVTAIYFSIFEPGPLAGPEFRLPFIRIYLGFTIFIKTLGLYLFLKRFTKSKIILIIAILYGNTFLSTTYYVNLTTNNFLSFLPLVIHLILAFFESKKLSDFCCILIVMAMLFCFSPYHTLNYTYLTLHFFLFSCIIYYFFYSHQGTVYRVRIKNALKNIFPGSLSLWWKTNLEKKYRKVTIRLLLLDAGAILLAFTIAWFIYVNFRHNKAGVFLEPYYFLEPWLKTTLLIVSLFLLFNFLLGNYTRPHPDGAFFFTVKILSVGFLVHKFSELVFIQYLNQPTILRPSLLFFVGYFLSMVFLILIRNKPLRYVKEIINEVKYLLFNFLKWIKNALLDFKMKNSTRPNYPYLFITIVLCIILVLPNLLMVKDILPTLSFDKSRAEAFTPVDYFNKPVHLAKGGIKAFPLLAINHLHEQDNESWSVYWRSYMYLGFSTLFLSFLAIGWSKDKRKYIFLIAYLFILLLNWNIPKIFNPFHIINAFTNPFSFTNRSFHGLFIVWSPTFLAPLVVLGIQTIFDFLNIGIKGNIYALFRTFKVCTSFFILIIFLLYFNSAPAQLFIHVITIFSLFSLMAVFIVNSRLAYLSKQKAVLGFAVIIFLFDGSAWSNYVNHLEAVSPIRKLERPLFSNKSYVMDGVSPVGLPLREYFGNRPIEEFRPDIKTNQDRFQGMYYQFVDLNRYLIPSDVYFARHKSYDVIAQNKIYSDYLYQMSQVFVKSKFALIGSDYFLNQLVKEKLTDEIILLNVEGGSKQQLLEKSNETIITSLDEFIITDEKSMIEDEINELVIPFSAAVRMTSGEKSNYQLYRLKSTDIPYYMSTMIATEDSKRFKASVGSHELYAVQGEIIDAFSFDVNNMISGGIIFSLPKGFESRETGIKISYKDRFNSGIVDVFRNTNDNLGLVIESESDGWLLYHAPYDEYWEAKINNEPTPIYKANGAFMAVPLQKGINRIEYSYMASSWIRELIFLSLVTSSIILCAFIFNALRLKPTNTEGA